MADTASSTGPPAIEATPIADALHVSGDDSGRRGDLFAVGAVAVGAVIRIVWGLGFHQAFEHIYSDMAGYVDRAQRLASGGPFQPFDSFYPAGTHVLLAAPFRIFGTGRAGLWAGAVLWTLLSCAIPFLVWRISRRLLDPRAAAIAAALTAFFPLFIVYGGFFMSEIPSITFLLLTILLGFKTAEAAAKDRWVYAAATGLSGGVAIVMRTQLALNVLIVAWVLLRKREGARRLALAALAGVLIPVIGVVGLNYKATDRITLSQNAGVNFFHAHCPVLTSYYVRNDGSFFWFAAPPSVQLNRGRDYIFNVPPDDQAFLVRQGLHCIRADGIKHVGIMIRNIDEMGLSTVPWPPSNERPLRRFVKPANVVYSIALPAIVVGGFVLWRRKRREGLRAGEGVLLAHLAPMVPLGAFFVGDPRYRMAYDAFGLALAASLISWGMSMYAARRATAPAETQMAGISRGPGEHRESEGTAGDERANP